MAETGSLNVLILGGRGQLGTDLVRTNPGHRLTVHGRADADVTDAPAFERYVRSISPAVVLNTVAFNKTEQCEDDPLTALAVNTLAPRRLAALCAEIKARLVHFSTDFVFDGLKGTPYDESDAPAPANLYGFSKYGGERFVALGAPDNLVIRTAGLYGAAGSGAKGGNFVHTVLTRARAGQPLRVVNDIFFSPTWTGDLAEKTWALLAAPAAGGIYHLANGGGCSWYEFARAVLETAGVTATVDPLSSSQWPGKMRRLPDTRLASVRCGSLGLEPLRPWREALSAYLRPATG